MYKGHRWAKAKNIYFDLLRALDCVHKCGPLHTIIAITDVRQTRRVPPVTMKNSSHNKPVMTVSVCTPRHQGNNANFASPSILAETTTTSVGAATVA